MEPPSPKNTPPCLRYRSHRRLAQPCTNRRIPSQDLAAFVPVLPAPPHGANPVPRRPFPQDLRKGQTHYHRRTHAASDKAQVTGNGMPLCSGGPAINRPPPDMPTAHRRNEVHTVSRPT